MENIREIFFILGLVSGLGTLVSLLRLRRQGIETGIAISGGINILLAITTVLSARGILMLPVPEWWVWSVTPVGLLIVVLSQALIIWSSRTLKANFSPKLKPVENGILITSGPYRICRHPIMLAMLMSWMGTALSLGSVFMLLVFSFVSILVMRRVALEEKLLEASYGEQFLAYKQEVSAVVPGLDPKTPEGQEMERAIDLLKSEDWMWQLGACRRKMQ